MRLKLNAVLRPMLAAAGILAGMLVVPAEAQAPELAMLAGLRKGSWEIHNRDDDSRSRICVRTGREFIQIRHRQAGCNQYVIEDGPGEVTVHYSCPRDGYGQTNVRKESTQLVQIHTQGVKGEAPFNFNAEGRFVGGC